jgi:hypothetical protein
MKDSSAMQHEFRVTGHWQGGRAGQGETVAEHVSTMISLPKELGGAGRGTNPEEMDVDLEPAASAQPPRCREIRDYDEERR